MPRPRGRRPSDFQISRDDERERDSYLENLERRKREVEPTVVNQYRTFFILFCVGLIMAAMAVFASIRLRPPIDEALIWGREGVPRDDGRAWVALCPKYARPITGTCVALRADDSPSRKDGDSTPVPSLQNFGVNDDNQWEC